MRQILLYNFPKNSPLKNELLQEVAKLPGHRVEAISIQNDALKYVKENPNIIFLMHINSSMDLIQAKVILSKVKNKILDASITPIAISDENNENFSKALLANHCKDIMPKSTTAQKIISKINLINSLLSSSDDSPIIVKDHESHKEDSPAKMISSTQTQALEIEDINLESGSINVTLQFNTQQTSCRLDHIDHEHLDLEIIKADFLIEAGKEVMVKIDFQYNGQSIAMNLKGNIIEVEKIEDGKKATSIKLSSSSTQFDEFIKLYQQRQTMIHEFMRQAKGTD